VLPCLTDHGRDMAQQVEKTWQTTEQNATSGLSVEEQRLFIEMIDKITENLDK